MAPETPSPTPAPPDRPTLTGQLLGFRQLDLAEEIALDRIAPLLGRDAPSLRFSRDGSGYLELPQPPVTVWLGERTLALGDRTLKGELRARLFAFGCASFCLHLPMPEGLTEAELLPLADALYDSQALSALCRIEAAQLAARLGPALRRPHLWEGEEGYTVIHTTRVEGVTRAGELTTRLDLPRLLLGERSPAALSAQERATALDHVLSYFEDDLAVIDWNAAFVHEPSGSMDVVDVLEIANAQLFELRYYDASLDQELDAIWDEVNGGGTPWWALFSPRRSQLRHRTLRLTLEMAEFLERVDNTLKVLGDVYLGRVFGMAVRQLRIPEWQQSVDRKQQLVAQVHELLKAERDHDRALFLELTVIALIAIEVAHAFGWL